jgi:hypothetical protein
MNRHNLETEASETEIEGTPDKQSAYRILGEVLPLAGSLS